MSTCEKTGKVIFWSERKAKTAMRNLVNAGRAGNQKFPLHVYRCGSHLHIGHDYRPRRMKKKVKR